MGLSGDADRVIAFATWLTINSIVEAPRDAAVGAGLIVGGLPFYLVLEA